MEIVSVTMLVRMLLSFFVDPMESRIYAITCFITEPFIMPVRAILYQFDIAQDSPIDWAFSITYMLIWLLGSILPAI
jgi:uncharacterized protein YggT (Ycf19 family)